MTTRILIGDVRAKLRDLSAGSVHAVWTSIPYWGLRAYGTEPQTWPSGWVGEHGQEPTLEMWLDHEVAIFRQVWRVLRDDGVVWLNVGDAYATTPNGRPADEVDGSDCTFRDKPNSTIGGIFKPKDRLGLPHRVVFALQADGWWFRDEIVLHKLNPMPSSVKDRTTPAHEMLFMLSKAERYFYDATAIAEPIAASSEERYAQPTIQQQKGGAKQDRYEAGFTGQRIRSRRPNEIIQSSAAQGQTTRQKRSVWSHAIEPFKEALFATAPTAWVRPCVLSSTSARGVCPDCGTPWIRVVRQNFRPQPDVSLERGQRGAAGQKPMDASSEWDGFPRGTTDAQTLGFRPGCACYGGQFGPKAWPKLPLKVDSVTPDEHAAACAPVWEQRLAIIESCRDFKTVPATVLDPFGGSGTTALVANELGRDAILIELNPEYARMARKRIRDDLGRVQSDMPDDKADDMPLFQGGAAA